MAHDKDWLQSHWRPMMAVAYMVTCIFDFIVAPIGWSVLQAYIGDTMTQWQPLTLMTGGFYHMAMGAILGVAAYTRGQEKIALVRSDNAGHANTHA